MNDNNSQKLALSESFERVVKVAEERAAFNEQMTKDPAAEWQAGYEAGVEACAARQTPDIDRAALLEIFRDITREAAIEECAKALEDDAIKCDCFAFEENECGCGAWCDYKSITSARAVEIVRALADKQ